MSENLKNSESVTANAANDCRVPCYGLREIEGRTLMLDILFRTGERRSYPYAYMIEAGYSRSVGISLRFTSANLLIRGRNLMPLYEAFVKQRVLWLQEGNPARDFLPEQEPFISAVEVAGR